MVISCRRESAVVGVIAREQSSVLYEHGHSFQDECDEELDVNEVPGTAKPPVENIWTHTLGTVNV